MGVALDSIILQCNHYINWENHKLIIPKFKLKELSKLDLLICDEWGYIPLEREGAQLLFHVVSDCYEQRSVILTTNLEFSRWTSVFYDEQMTAAMIDRLVHHGHLLIFDGPSHRMRESLMKMEG